MKKLILCAAFITLIFGSLNAQTDARLLSIDAPATQCVLKNNEPVKITFSNNGSTTITTANVCFIGDVNPQVCEVWNGTLLPGQSTQYTFTGTVNFSGVSTHFMFAYVDVVGDANGGNDSIWGKQVVHEIVWQTGSYTENFESLSNGETGTLFNAWIGSPTNGYHWESNSGGTPTNNTGPDADHTTPGSRYMFTEANGSTNGSITNLQSVCSDLTGIFNPVMDFWYHKYGSVAQMGDLYVDVWTYASGWVTTDSIKGPTHGSSSEAWKMKSSTLNPGGNQIMRYRFRAKSPGGNLGDMAIDDIKVREAYFNDGELLEIISPKSGCALGAAEPVTIRIINRGNNVIGGFNATYDFGVPFTEPVGIPIFPGDTADWTFTTPANLSTPGNYTFDIYFEVDQNADNDSILNYSVTSSPTIVAPFIEDFETALDGETGSMSNLWEGNPTGAVNYHWEANSGLTPSWSAGTGPNGDHTTGSGIYAYTEATNSNNNNVAYLYSPCIDLSGMTSPTMDFYYHKFGTPGVMGDLYVDVFDGSNWNLAVDAILGATHTSNSDPWARRSVDLSAFAGIDVSVRFRGVSHGGAQGDMAIDDIGIHDPYTTDAEAVTAILPPDACGFTTTEPVSMKVTNVGLDTLTNINVSYDYTGTPVVELIAGPLYPGDTIIHVFAATANLSAAATYVFSFGVGAAGDQNPFNDSIVDQTVINSGFIATPYSEDFESLGNGELGLFSNGWEGNPAVSGQYWWEANAGTTPTGGGGWGTGPGIDHTLGTNAGIYLYTEATPSSAGNVATVSTPCISLAGLSVPTLEFWYHRFGVNLGTMYVDVFDGSSWTNGVTSISGQTHFSLTDPYDKAQVSLAPWVGQSINLRFRAVAAGGWSGDMAFDDINIRDAYLKDADLFEVVSPKAGCGLGATEAVSVKIRNSGLDTLVNFDVGFDLTGTPVIETVTDTIFPGDVYIFSFAATVDLSIPGTYSMDLWSGLIGDEDKSNDTIFNHDVSNATVSLVGAFFENLESLADGEVGALSNGWLASPLPTNYNWEVNTGGTPTGMTGPNGDHTTGTGKYLYTEASNGSPGNIATVTTPCIDASGLVAPVLEYWYHKRGNTMGDLYVDLWTPTTGWILDMDAVLGTTHASSADPYLQHTVDLSQGGGGLMRLRFRAKRGSAQRGDMVIDDINLRDAWTADAAAVSVVSPNNGCGLSAAEPVSFMITNAGIDTISNFDLSYNFTGVPVVETYVGSLGPGDTVTFNFATTADLSILDTTYTFSFATQLIGDQDAANNSITGHTVYNGVVILAPFMEDFETLADDETGLMSNGWLNDQVGGYAWQSNIGMTQSGCCGAGMPQPVGPEVDHTTGTALGVYLHVEASGTNNGDVGTVTSTCIDLGTLIEPAVGFWYHKFGANMGGLFVDVYDGTTWTMDIGGSVPGQTQFAKSDPWLFSSASLAPWAGQEIKIRFRGVADGNFAGDISIDDVSVFEDADTLNVATVSGGLPADACALSATEIVSITVTNRGLHPISNFDVSYDHIGAPITETITDTLQRGDTITYVFTTPVDLSVAGIYDFDFWSELANDQDASNDAVSGFRVVSYPTIIAPFTEDFESNADGENGLMTNYWLGEPDGIGNYYWESNMGNTPTGGTGPTGDHTSGSGIYVFTESTPAPIGAVSSLLSPCIDLSATNNPLIEYWFHKFGGAAMGDLYMDVYDGATWTMGVDTVLGTVQTTGADAWMMASADLGAWAGQTVRLQFRGVSNGPGLGDMAIDDINLIEQVLDIEAFDASVPATSCALGSSESVSITVKNTGVVPVSNFPVYYDFTGTPVTEMVTDTLDPGESLIYVFTTTADLSAVATYNFNIWHEAAGDMVPGNDSILGLSTSHSPVLSAPYLEDFESVLDGENGLMSNLWFGDPDTSATYYWEANTGTTPTASTGPNGDHTTGSGMYVFTEASSAALGAINNIVSPCIDLAPLTDPVLEYWYHKFGNANMGTLHVDVYDGSIWTNSVQTIAGSTHATGSDPWTRTIIDLAGWSGQTVNIRFRGISNGPGLGDMAIDDFHVREKITDIQTLAGYIPANDCDLGSEQISILVTNSGEKFAANFGVSYDYTGVPVTELIADTLWPGDSVLHVFAANANLSVAGTYTFDFWTTLLTDQNLLNDSLFNLMVTNVPTVLAPFTENFETAIDGESGVMSNFWEGIPDASATYYWEANSGGTPTAGTGPSGDHTTGAGIYAYTEATPAALGNNAGLLSPCIDLNTLIWPTVDYWYHKFGTASMGNLYVDVYDGTTWSLNVHQVLGTTHGSSAAPWNKATVDLTAWAGQTIRLRFRAIANGGGAGDMAIDDLNLYDLYTGDAAATQGIVPTSGCGLTSTEIISMQITNPGLSTISGFNVSYDFTGTPVTEAFLGSLAPGGSATHVFATTANLSASGAYVFDFWTDYPGDLDLTNDSSMNNNVTNYVVKSTPYSEDFESLNDGDKGWMTNDWHSTPIVRYHWEANVGSTPGFGTGPLGDHTTKSGVYMYTDATVTAFGEIAELLTPCLDLDSLADPILAFWFHKHGAGMSDLVIDVKSAGVWNMGVDSVIGRTHWGDFEPWKEHITSLEDYKGEVVQIRFRGIGVEDWRNEMAIDDINIQSFDPTAIREVTELDLSIGVHPNPTSGQVFIKGAANVVGVVVLDVSGRIVLTGNESSFDITNEPAGLYFVRITSNDQLVVKRLMKQ